MPFAIPTHPKLGDFECPLAMGIDLSTAKTSPCFLDGAKSPMACLLGAMNEDARACFTESYAQIVRAAVERCGPTALVSGREDAAAHEAGHAVLYAATATAVRSA